MVNSMNIGPPVSSIFAESWDGTGSNQETPA